MYIYAPVNWRSARVMPIQWMWKGVMDRQISRQTDIREEWWPDDAEGDCEGNDGYGFQSHGQIMRQVTNAELQWFTNRHGPHLTVMSLWESTYWAVSHLYSAVRQAVYDLLPVCVQAFIFHCICTANPWLGYVCLVELLSCRYEWREKNVHNKLTHTCTQWRSNMMDSPSTLILLPWSTDEMLVWPV